MRGCRGGQHHQQHLEDIERSAAEMVAGQMSFLAEGRRGGGGGGLMSSSGEEDESSDFDPSSTSASASISSNPSPYLRNDVRSETAHEAFFRMCASGDADSIAQGLARGEFSFDLTDRRGRGAMHYAVSGSARGKLAFLRWLCLKGLERDVNAQDHDGVTPVHVASEYGSIKVLSWLKRHGAQMDAEDDDGCSALFAAAACDRVKALDWLTSKCRLDVSATDDNGYTCLHEAVANGSKNAAAWLKENGLGHIVVEEIGDEDPLGFDDFDTDDDDDEKGGLLASSSAADDSVIAMADMALEMVSLNISDLGTPKSDGGSPKGGFVATAASAIFGRFSSQRGSQVVAPLDLDLLEEATAAANASSSYQHGDDYNASVHAPLPNSISSP